MSSGLQEQLRILQKDRRNTALMYLGIVYLLLILLFLCYAYLPFPHLLWIIPTMGIVQYYIVISGHEAVHSTLCYPQKMNDFWGVLGQALVGVNFTAYRLQHIDHHRAKEHSEDPDAHIYLKVMSVPRGWKRFLYLTLGTLIEIVVKIRQKGSGGYGTERKIKKEIEQKMKRDSLFVVLAQLTIMLLCFLCMGGLPWSLPEGWWLVELGLGLVWSYLWLWIVPLFGITVFLNRCRIVIEHGLALEFSKTQDFGGPRIPTIDLVPNPIERRIFAPFLFNYHCSHHLFMSVPHYNLPKLNQLLAQNQHKGHHQIEGGYLRAIWFAINH